MAILNSFLYVYQRISGKLPSELLFLKVLCFHLLISLSYLPLKIENLSIDLTSGAAMPRHRASPCGSGATERRRCWGMIKRKYQ